MNLVMLKMEGKWNHDDNTCVYNSPGQTVPQSSDQHHESMQVGKFNF